MTATDPGPPIVAALAQVLARRSSEAVPRVAVVVDDRERPAADEIRRRWPDAVVVPVVIGSGGPRLHVQLAAHGPFDAVVDLLGRGSARRRAHLLGHLRAGGAGSGGPRRAPRPPGRTGQRCPSSGTTRRPRCWGSSPAAAALLDTVPGERWRARSRLRTSGPLPVNPTPEEYDAPAMYLREYHDVVCLPRQLVLQRALVLPETFTTVEQQRQRNAFLTKTGVDFAEPPAGLDAAAPLPGRWFHLDNHMIGHFGHAVSEQLSHLWGWHRARSSTRRCARWCSPSPGRSPRGSATSCPPAASTPRRCTWARRRCAWRRWSGAPPCSAVPRSCTPRSGRRTTRSGRLSRPGPAPVRGRAGSSWAGAAPSARAPTPRSSWLSSPRPGSR